MELNGASLGSELRALVKVLFKLREDETPPPKEQAAVVIFTIEPPKPKRKP